MVEIVVIAEASADAQIATHLAERLLLEKIEWINPYLKELLKWRGLEESTTYTPWSALKKLSQTTIPRIRPRFDSLRLDATIMAKIYYEIRQQNAKVNGLLLVRDLDNQPDRKSAFAEGRHLLTNDPKLAHFPKLEIILALPCQKREGWVLNGFEPQNNDERMRLEELKESLTFNPCLEAHRLRSTKKTGEERERNIKIVLADLTNSDFERERLCWEETPLSTLRTNGIETGLTDYLDEVENRLLPLIN